MSAKGLWARARTTRTRKATKAAGQALPWLVLAGVAGTLAIDELKARRRAAEEHPAGEPRDRGRRAEQPAAIPRLGWKDIAWRTVREVQADDIVAVARGVAFAGVLAVFPALAAFVSIYGLFADVGAAREHLAALTGFVPAAALTMIGDQMVRIADANDAGLSATAASGLLLSVWSANSGMKALVKALNVAFEEDEKRNLVKLHLITLAFTVGGVAFFGLAAAAVIGVPAAIKFIGAAGILPLLEVLRWPALLAVMVVGLAILYRFGPSREDARWRWITPGAVAAALLWMAASGAFSWYLTNVADYEATYGSLGAVFGFMIWTWLSVLVVLFGAELNAEIEHQTAKDSTTGAPEPLGERGATMADEVGEPAPASVLPEGVRKWLPKRRSGGAAPMAAE